MMKLMILILTILMTLPAWSAVNVTVAGSTYSVPSEEGEEGWANDLTTWIQAISQNSLYLSGGTYVLTADLDLGDNFGVLAPYYKPETGTPASVGVLRLAEDDSVAWRNEADSADVVLAKDNSDNLTVDGDIVALLTATQTLTNKTLGSGTVLTSGLSASGMTLTSPTINTSVTGTAILDEDNMASDSASQLATQQSIKAYVDAGDSTLTSSLAGKVDDTGDTMTGGLTMDNQSGFTMRELTVNGTESILIQPPSALGANWTLTLPSDDGNASDCLKSNGAGVTSWDVCASGTLATTGGTMTGDINMDNATSILFSESDGNGSEYAEIKAPSSIGASYVLTLPLDDGNANDYLQSDGSGNLSWASVSGVNLQTISKTTTYTADATADDIILADTSGGAWSLALPAAAGADKKKFVIKFTDSGFNALTIDPNSTELIGGDSVTTLNTEGETLTIVSDGTGWNIVNRHIPSVWTSYTPGGSWSANMTAEGAWKRVGDSIIIRYSFDMTGAPTGVANFDIPTGLTFDTSKMLQEFNFSAQNYGMLHMLIGSTAYVGKLGYTDTNTLAMQYYDVSGTYQVQFNVSPTSPATWGSGDHLFGVTTPIPITGWKGN